MVSTSAQMVESDELLRARGERLDAEDPLSSFRAKFNLPTGGAAGGGGGDGGGKAAPCVYLCGNSLGAQPAATRDAVLRDLQGWRELGVEGHFTQPHSWVDIEDTTTAMGARLVGARESEVVHMNSLTVNLHLMMVAFYRPERGGGGRRKIMMEQKAFPSDEYAIQSQVEHHGLDPARDVIRLAPRPGEQCLRTEDVLRRLEEEGEEVALVLMSGVQYYTGQLFEIERITAKAKRMGCAVGWDLAHAAGNVPLRLHDWGVDFAVWCTYKYLNSGPGSIAGCFVHEDHHHDRYEAGAGGGAPARANPRYLGRFAGWWGHDRASRFQMDDTFVPQRGAYGFQLSNPPTLPMRQLAEALKVYDAAGMDAIRAKSELLTRYLEDLIAAMLEGEVEVITPAEPQHRGAQLSLVFTRKPSPLKFVHDRIRSEDNIIVDFREPDVIRVAAAPLYNRFGELYTFVRAVRGALDAHARLGGANGAH